MIATLIGALGALVFVVLSHSSAFAVTVNVEGFRNPYLAGMPEGTVCCAGIGGSDTAPAHSPVGPIAVSPGQIVTFTASGAVSNGTGCTPPCSVDPPDGGDFFTSQTSGQPGTDSSNGIARVNAPVNALVGVFLDNSQPNASAAPAGLDFSGPTGRSFPSLSPGLKQPFFIGDGLTGTGSGAPQQFVVPAGATRLFLGTVDGVHWSNNPGQFVVDFVVSGGGGGAGPLASAVLPSSRSVQVGATATAFVTILNAGGAQATGCTLSPGVGVPATFLYQTTNPATNQLTGSPNTPASVPPGGGQGQSFLVAFTPNAPFGPTDVPLIADCANTDAAPVISGLNTLLLSASASPVPDIVAVAASAGGIVNIPGTTGTGVFAVATFNLGAGALINVTADTVGVPLPVVVTVCETNSAGDCLAPAASSVTTQIDTNETPTFGIFVRGTGNVAFNAALNRIRVLFTDLGGIVRGATTVAARTQ
jgi:hypothetical protein